MKNKNEFELDKNLLTILIDYIKSIPKLNNRFNIDNDGNLNINYNLLIQVLDDIDINLDKTY